MAKINCANCKTAIAFYSSRHKTKDGQHLCNNCFKLSDIPITEVKKYTVSELFSNEPSVSTKTKSKHRKEQRKAHLKAVKEGFKQLTAGKPFISVLIRQDSSKTFKSSDLSVSFDYIYQHEAGKVIINNQKEYILKDYSWTPLIEGSKQFSVGKALTGAALVGELGLLAGASGKKGKDKSYCNLLLKEVDTDNIVKITADCSSSEATKLSNFITESEVNM